MIKAANKSNFVCSKCGHKISKWEGKCGECGSWNSYVEDVSQNDTKSLHRVDISQSSNGHQGIESIESVLEKISTSKEKRSYSFGNKELDSFWGANGLIAGSLTLFAGEPGLGKSTFCLQLLRALRKGSQTLKLLYITAEESTFELARRSQRLDIPTDVLLLQANNLESILSTIESAMPDVVILDSVQTVYTGKIESSPGSLAQVSTVTSSLLSVSKGLNIAICLVGHVTKDGQIAGPKTLEHLVDSVLVLEGSKNPTYRTLSFSKHRFGTTDNLLLLKMDEKGLSIVKDSSLALLENIEEGVGVVYSMAMEKNLPLVIEVQTLANKNHSSDEEGSKQSFGRKEAIGITNARLNTILAIIEKYLGINLKSYDIYLQVFGLPKNFYDDSIDLAILLSILSSINNLQIEFLYPKLVKSDTKITQKPVFSGRLTLAGNIRKPTNIDARDKTATKLGFNFNPLIQYKDLKTLFGKNK